MGIILQASDLDLRGFLASGAICSIENDLLLVSWGSRTWTKAIDKKVSFYAPDFFLKSESPFFYHENSVVIKKDEFNSFIQGAKKNSYKWDPLNWESFEEGFYNFLNSDLKKAVPYVEKVARCDFLQEDLVHSLKSALEYQKQNPFTYLYGYWGEGEGMLGVTPELLLKKQENQAISLMACAGTAPIASIKSIMNDAKLQKEHQLVVDGILESLKEFGNVDVEPQEIRAFSTLAHLVTPLSLKIKKSRTIQELIQSLHPTPALGAYPKNEGNPWLANYDKKCPRGSFGAPFGVFLSPDEAYIYIAIRGMHWNKNRIQLRAGCGILKESQIDDEKNEVQCKLKAIEEILGLC